MRARVAALGAAAAAGLRGSLRRLRADQRRFALIRGAALIADSGGTVPEVIERVRALLVPAFADACEIHLGAAEHAPGADAGRPAALARAHDRDDGAERAVARLHARGPRVRAPARRPGRRSRSRTPSLESREAWLTTALGTLAEAVTIQDDRGALVYANDAAAQALGFDTAEELLATPPREIVGRVRVLPRGRLAAADGPAARAAGCSPARRRSRWSSAPSTERTGEERWRIVKATAVPGRARLAVNVIEDVTEVKRAEVAQRFLAEAGAVLASSLDYERDAGPDRGAGRPAARRLVRGQPPRRRPAAHVAVAHADPDKVALRARRTSSAIRRR